MKWRDVFESDSGYWIYKNGIPHLIQFHGHQLSRADFTHADFRVKSMLCSDHLSLLLLEELKGSGLQSEFHAWYLDRNLSYVGNTIQQISDVTLAVFRETFDERMLVSLSSLATDAGKTSSEQAAIGNFIELIAELAVSKISHIDGSEVELFVTENGDGLYENIFLASPEFCQRQILTSAKFKHNTAQGDIAFHFTHSLIIEETRLSYASVSNGELQYIAFFSFHHNTLRGIWDIQNRAVITKNINDDEVHRHIRGLVARFVASGSLLRTYLMSDTQSIVIPVSYDHLGHHLVNELTGLVRLAKELDLSLQQSTPVTLARVSGGEHFGPVKVLVPEIADIPICDFETWRELERFIYHQNCMLVRLTGNRISEELAGKIQMLSHALVQEADPEFSKQFERKYPNELIVVLGLRVENRTWRGQKTGLLAIVRKILSSGKRACLILDGHNSSALDKGTFYNSFSGAGQPKRSPVEVEREIRDFLITELAGESGVRIISMVGDTVARNIVALDAADFFIAPWGAGFAKYKWISNLPGVVLCSAWNLQHRPDLSIYERSGLREGSQNNKYVPIEYIRDLPDEESLIPNWGHPSFWNFEVTDMEALFNLIGTAIDEVPMA